MNTIAGCIPHPMNARVRRLRKAQKETNDHRTDNLRNLGRLTANLIGNWILVGGAISLSEQYAEK
jgi:hypothetical protein